MGTSPPKFEGVVVDSEGQPVAKAIVVAAPTSDDLHDPRLKKTVVADAKGRFVVRGIKTRTAVFIAASPLRRGFNQVFVSKKVSLAAKKPLVLKIDLGVVVSGKVVSQQGKPVSGAVVEAFLTRLPDLGPIPSSPTLEAVTGKDGRFCLRQLGSRDAEVTVNAIGFTGEPVDLEDAPDDLVVTLRRVAIVQGRVVDDAGKPIRKFKCGSSGLFAESDFMFGGEECVSSTGAFKINLGLPQKLVKLIFVVPGRSPVEREFAWRSGLQRVDDVVIPTGRTVALKVLDPEARPLAGVWSSGNAEVTSDSKGRLKVTGLPDGDLTLRLHGPDLPSKEVKCGAGVRELTVTFERGGRIEGVAVDELGKLIPRHRVSLEGPPYDSTTTDENGKFEFHAIKPGTYRVGANDDGRVRFHAQEVVVQNGVTSTVRLLSRFPYLG
jgi:protocatechuate 3,4-dioxygenase beta subunit